jgi:hypothetical protein
MLLKMPGPILLKFNAKPISGRDPMSYAMPPPRAGRGKFSPVALPRAITLTWNVKKLALTVAGLDEIGTVNF